MPSTSGTLQISLPPRARMHMPTPSPPPVSAPFRQLGSFLGELLFTVVTSFTLLLALLHAFGLESDAAAAPMGVLHLTIACTGLVYLAIEGISALLRWMRCSVSCADIEGEDYDWDADGLDSWELEKKAFAMSPMSPIRPMNLR